MEDTVIFDYLNYCHSHKRLSKHSIRAYKNDLLQCYHICQFDINAYIDYLSQQTFKVKTLKRKIASLKTFYAYLEHKNLIADNPFHHTRFQFKSEKSLPKTIPLPYLQAIYNYLSKQKHIATTSYQKEKAHRNLLITELLISTGLRISELCSLSINQINLQSRFLTIIGKGKKERLIYLGNTNTYKLLKEYIHCYRTDNYFLFQNTYSKNHLSEQAVRLMFKTICKKINIDKSITPHMFRHTFATMLLDNDVDTRYIQQILGHSSIAVTQIYTHVSQYKQQTILTHHNPINTLQKNL